MVNYDSNKFTISNVNFTDSTNIVAVGPSSTCIVQAPVTSLPNAANGTITSTTSSTSLSAGASAGIAIGCVACVALLGAALFLFIRRRRAKRNGADSIQDGYGPADPRRKFNAGELPAGEKVGELRLYDALPPELPHNQDHQIAQEMPS